MRPVLGVNVVNDNRAAGGPRRGPQEIELSSRGSFPLSLPVYRFSFYFRKDDCGSLISQGWSEEKVSLSHPEHTLSRSKTVYMDN